MSEYLKQIGNAFPGTATLVLAALGVGLIMSGCDSGGTNPSPDASDLGDVTGSITGQVIDNATSDPVEGAEVVVAAGSLDTDAESFSATTGSEGRFAISGLPAATADDGSDSGENPSATYGIRVEMPDGSAYRDAYRGQVELAYGNNETGAVELVANITFPLKKTNGSLSGQLSVSSSDAPLRNTELRASQSVDVEFDANGDATGGNGTLSVSATTTTDEQGAFTFENLVVGENASLFARFEGDSFEQNIGNGFVPDEGDAAPIEQSVRVPAFEVVSITPDPDPEIDVGDARPSFVFTFNRPVADNETVNTLADDGDIFIETQSPERKDLTGSNDIKVETSFNDDRTELTVTPTQDLSDGFRYRHVAEPSFDSGLDNPEFTDGKYGRELDNPAGGNINFTVGLNNSAPATPSLSFDSDDPRVNDDGELIAGNFNYNDGTVTAPLQVDEVDNSDAEVKGYEVFYSSQDIREDRSANTGNEFLQAGEYERSFVTDQLGSGFEESDNIIDAGEAEFGNGRLTFFALTDDNNPFAAEDGSYGDVQVTVRAVSINNERSAFSDTLTIADNDSLGLNDAQTQYVDRDRDGTDDALRVEFDEPVSGISAGDAGTDYFDINDGSGTPTTLGNVAEVDNDGIDDGVDATVVVTLDDDGSNTANDEMTVNGESSDNFVTDLAGNPIEVGDADENVDTGDDNQDFGL